MGMETPIPPVMIVAAAPGGSLTFISEKHRTAPPCPARGPEPGSPHSCDFHGSGV